MTPEQQTQLCRLLQLKRFEQPPPGYFDNFSGRVIARIKAGEALAHESLTERLFREAPWIQRLLTVFEAKPAAAGAFGVLVCALLISGIIYSERTDYTPVALTPVPSEANVTPAQFAPAGPLSQPAASPVFVSSTNPIIQPSGSLFEQMPLDVQRVGSQSGGN